MLAAKTMTAAMATQTERIPLRSLSDSSCVDVDNRGLLGAVAADIGVGAGADDEFSVVEKPDTGIPVGTAAGAPSLATSIAVAIGLPVFASPDIPATPRGTAVGGSDDCTGAIGSNPELEHAAADGGDVA